MTLTAATKSHLDLETMQNYLQSLKELLNTYLKAHNT